MAELAQAAADFVSAAAAKQARYEAQRRAYRANLPTIVVPPEQAYWVVPRGLDFTPGGEGGGGG